MKSKYASNSVLNENNDDALSDLSSLSDICDQNVERCPICLSRFKSQDIANPSSCEHKFCLECLEEWSKVC